MKKYGWGKEEFPVDPQIAGTALEELMSANGGDLPLEKIVDAARPDDAPLHKCFTWSNDRAAELYRIEEARKIKNSIRVVQNYVEPREVTPMRLPPPPPKLILEKVYEESPSGMSIRPVKVATRSDHIRTAINDALDKLTAAGDKLAPFQELEKYFKDVKGCEAEVKTILALSRKVCAEIEKIEAGLVDHLRPPKRQPKRDERRMVAI